MNESSTPADHGTSRRIIQLLPSEGYTAVWATLTKDKHVLTRSRSVDLWTLVEIHDADGRVTSKVEGLAIEPTIRSLETDLEEGAVFLGYDSTRQEIDWDQRARERLKELGKLP